MDVHDRRQENFNTPRAAKAQSIIVGLDEAGRGPLAGPVVAGAVILNPERPIPGLADSKKLSPAKREALFELIHERALSVGVGFCTAQEIDAINILQASLLAMRRAYDGLTLQPCMALVDGNKLPLLPCAAKAIVRGDQTQPCISAASIIAKVTRDRYMLKLHERYPDYGFNQHQGYPTVRHLAALEQFGIMPEHRMTFGPVFSLKKRVAIV